MKKTLDKVVERAFADLSRELHSCPPELEAIIIDGLVEARGCALPEAIREWLEFKRTTDRLLEATRRLRPTTH